MKACGDPGDYESGPPKARPVPVGAHDSPLMSIARRLVVLLAVPLLALAGLGVFSRLQLTDDRDPVCWDPQAVGEGAMAVTFVHRYLSNG